MLSTILGALGLVSLHSYLERLVALHTAAPHLAMAKLGPLLLGTAGLVFLSTLGLVGVLTYVAIRVLSSGQYPPPGMRVLQDTRLQTGKRARTRAIVGLVLAAVVLLCGSGASVLLVRRAYDPAPIPYRAEAPGTCGVWPPTYGSTCISG